MKRTCADCSASCASYRCAACNDRHTAAQAVRRAARSPEAVARARAYQRAYTAKKYARRRAAGLCVGCGLAESERAYCASCRKVEAKRSEENSLARALVRAIAARSKK